jgi:hypothetical protein
MNWWCRGKTSAWLYEDQQLEPGCWQFFLLGNAQTSEIIPGWEREQPRKTPVWAQEHFTILNIPGWGRGISGKITVWEQVHYRNFQKTLENSGL